MKDGAILANTGHFNVEIDIPALRALATETREAREFVEEFTLADGRRIYLLAEGRLVNLSAAEGHPALVMDMSFANQALSAEYAVQNAAALEKKVYAVPEEIDNEIARLKLATMGVDDRPADRGAGEVPGLVGRRHLSPARELEPEDILRLDGDRVVLLDQRRLPGEEVELECRAAAEVADAIRTLAVRGAPAIGDRGRVRLRARGRARGGPDGARRASSRESRPTAVNLVWALERDGATTAIRPSAARADPPRRGRALPAMAAHAAELVAPGTTRADALQRGRARHRRLRHAPSGRSAPRGSAGLVEHVWVDETRPLLQGARLTAWELERARHPAHGDRRLGRRRR